MTRKTGTSKSGTVRTVKKSSGKSVCPRQAEPPIVKKKLSSRNGAVRSQVEELRARLAEAEETLRAIRSGEVDALVVAKPDGDQIFTLRGAEHVYRLLIEEMNEGAATLNPGALILYCNNALSSMLGMPLEKIMGMSFRNYLSIESQIRFDKFLNQSFAKGGKTEVMLKTAKRGIVPVLLSGRKLSSDSDVNWISMIVTDLTAQKQAEKILRMGCDELEAQVWQRTEQLRRNQHEVEIQNEELRAAHEELEASRAKFTELYESAPVGYFTLEGDGLIRQVNIAGANLFGLQKGELINKPFSMFIDQKANREVFEEHCSLAYLKHLPRSCDLKLKRGNGSLFDANLQTVAVRDPERQIVSLQTTVTDITVRKWAEDALRESEARYRSLVELSPDAVIVCTEGKFVYLNPSGLRLFGAGDAGKLIGTSFLELVPPGDHEPLHERIRDIYDRGLKIPLSQMKILQLDGKVVDVELTAMPITYQARTAALVVIRDITERKRSEEALRQSEDRFRLSLSTVPITVATLDRDLRYTWVYNTRHGFRPEQVLGRRADELLPLKDAAEVVQMQERVLQTGVGARDEVEGITNGKRWVYDAIAEPIRNEGGEVTGITWVVLDITERRQAEDALMHHEELLREYVNLLEYAPVLVRNVNDRIILWNSGMQKIYGYMSAEAINRNSHDLLKRRFPRPLSEIMAHLYSTGRWEGELCHQTRDGREIIVASLWILHKKADGRPSAIIEIDSDITGRRRAEEELRRLNEELETRVRERTHDLARTISTLQSEIADRISAEEALLQSQINLAKAQAIAGIGSWSYDLGSKKVVWSEELYKIFAIEPGKQSEYLDSIVPRLIHPDDWKKLRSTYRKLISNEKAKPIEYRIQLPDGRKRVVWAEAEMVYDEQGKPATVVGIVQDITERKRAQEELIRLATAIESAGDALVVTDPSKGLIQYVNPAFEKVTGYAREEVIGRDLHILDSGRQTAEFYENLRETLKREGVWSGRLINKKKDGSLYEEDCTYSSVKDETGRIINYISIKRDVTEKVRLETIAQAVDTMNNIGYIFSGVSHEIGNPVNAIQMILKTMKQKCGALSREKLSDYLDRAIMELSKVEYLLKTFKNFNMYESLQPQQVELAPFMEMFLSLVKKDFTSKGVKLEYTPDERPKSLHADPRALQQILLNVLTNASDALEGHDRPTITISTAKTANTVRITIRDNGCGIEEGRIKDLFKPFHTSKKHGTGLGLVIIKKMLAKMNGTVSLESRLNEGTTVELTLPSQKPGGKAGKV